MKTQMIKLILGGALLGAGLFFVPFLILKVFLFFAIAGLLFRLFGGRRHHGHYWSRLEYVRSLSNEDFEKYKNAHHMHGCGRGYNQNSPQ
jgi:hypothetical protein